MNLIVEQAAADRQVAEAMAAEYESLSLECRADATRLERLLAPDFHEFGASGGEIGYEGTAELVAESTDPDGELINLPSSGHDHDPLTGDCHHLRVRAAQVPRWIGWVATACVHMHLIYTTGFYFAAFVYGTSRLT
jgi:hypothetical protein